MTDKPKHAGGRPTKYKAEYATVTFMRKFIKHCKKVNEVVSLCGLAVYVEVCEETLQEWKRQHPEFSVSLNKIKQISKNQLFNMGLQGQWNAPIVKLGLSANHGMNEKQEQDVNLTAKITVVDFASIDDSE